MKTFMTHANATICTLLEHTKQYALNKKTDMQYDTNTTLYAT